MPAYESDKDKFAELDAQVVGISVDSHYCHIAWQQKSIGMLSYPLLSDFWPHGEVATKYGLMRFGPPLPGITERAIFVVDKEGKLAFCRIYELGEQPENEEVLSVLRALEGK